MHLKCKNLGDHNEWLPCKKNVVIINHTLFHALYIFIFIMEHFH